MSEMSEDKPVSNRDTGFWDFIEAASDIVPQRLAGVDAATMRLVMALRRSTDMIFYDLHVILTREKSFSSTGAMRILLALYVSGQCRPQDVAGYTGMSRAQVSALLDTMVSEGLVTRTADESDRRSLLVEATALGRERFESYFVKHAQRESKWFDALDPAEKDEAFRLLDKVVRAHAGDRSFHRRS